LAKRRPLPIYLPDIEVDEEKWGRVPNIRQLEYLVAVADTRHFRRAAERTNTTQPTLSEQLKALEERLGAQLVERSTSRVVLTATGAQVVEIARRILRDAQEIRSVTSAGDKGLLGLLRLALPPTIGPYLFKYAAPQLHESYPGLRLYVREEMAQLLPRALEEGLHDVIITPGPIRGAEIESVPLFREPLVLTLACDHALASRKQVRLADLKGEDFLALAPGHYLHEPVQTLCQEAGAHLRFDFEGTSLDMLREMVIMGLGITFMPGLYAGRELVTDPAVKLYSLEDRDISRTIMMAWRKTSARKAAYAELAGFFRRIVRTIPELNRLEPA
jgi:LysR family transcriptional regulator, hydrogen peroxide-inducible genes activator